MPAIDIVRDAPRTTLAPVDPNVRIPDSVRRQTEATDALIKQMQTPQEVAPEPVLEPAAPAPAPAPAAAAPAAPSLAPEIAPAPAPAEDAAGVDWQARYNSMKGRFDQGQKTIGSLQEQIGQMGDELMRSTQALQAQPQPQPQPRPTNVKLITEKDVEDYGTELIDVAKRAALEVVGPEIETLRNENQHLKRSQANRVLGELYGALDRDLPDWRSVNKDPRFIAWLRLPDVYTGTVRKALLDAAFRTASAPRVKAFFEGFLREQEATGHVDPSAPPSEQPPQAPRVAATTLETLAAPGRAKPAGGDNANSVVDKPTFTRSQITQFYSEVRRGAYHGRQPEKDALEQQIFAAQREGRIRG